MGSPRGVLVGVLLVLALVLGTVGWIVRPGESTGLAAEATEAGLEPSGNRAEERDLEEAPPAPDALPEALAATFDKRYRGFGPEALDLARAKLTEMLRVNGNESSRELSLEIAWLDSRLPKKE